MDRVITRGARSLATRELVGCDPADAYIHRQLEVFSSLLLLGSGARLGWRRHFLPVFLHEAVSRLMPSIDGCVLEFSRWAGYVDQQFLAQGLPRSSLHQPTIGVVLYVVDVLPQWTSLECGLPHQFSLGMLGGPKAGWHLDTHGHVTTTPLLKDEVVKNAQSYIRRRATIIFCTLSPDHEAVKYLSVFGDQAQLMPTFTGSPRSLAASFFLGVVPTLGGAATSCPSSFMRQ